MLHLEIPSTIPEDSAPEEDIHYAICDRLRTNKDNISARLIEIFLKTSGTKFEKERFYIPVKFGDTESIDFDGEFSTPTMDNLDKLDLNLENLIKRLISGFSHNYEAIADRIYSAGVTEIHEGFETLKFPINKKDFIFELGGDNVLKLKDKNNVDVKSTGLEEMIKTIKAEVMRNFFGFDVPVASVEKAVAKSAVETKIEGKNV